MVISVTLKNNHMAGGKRQVAKSLTLKKPEVEALKEVCRDRPELQELLVAIEEVSMK